MIGTTSGKDNVKPCALDVLQPSVGRAHVEGVLEGHLQAGREYLQQVGHQQLARKKVQARSVPTDRFQRSARKIICRVLSGLSRKQSKRHHVESWNLQREKADQTLEQMTLEGETLA